MNTRHLLLVVSGVLITLYEPFAAQAQEHAGHASSDKPWSQADAYFDPEDMNASRAHLLHHHGDNPYGLLMLDRAEIQVADNEEIGVWDGSFSYGGDINRFKISSEAEYSFDHEEFEDAEVQLLWSRAISTYFNAEAGLRYDVEPEGLAHAVIGFEGLAPYWFEIGGAAYLSEKGDLTADFEVEYDFLLTQRLILQPRAEFQLSAQEITERDTGSGLTNIEAGLRLRYEIKREFAPYIGVEHHSALGDTGDFIEAVGGDADQTVWTVGVRSWF